MKLRLVKAASGVSWMRQGVQVFWRQPIALTGLFFMFLGLMTLVSLVPVIGGVLAAVAVLALLGWLQHERQVSGLIWWKWSAEDQLEDRKSVV